MIALARQRLSVAELMRDCQLDVGQLAEWTGLDERIVQAIVYQRYTPSPEQRRRISDFFGVDRRRIVWGHFAAVDEECRAVL